MKQNRIKKVWLSKKLIDFEGFYFLVGDEQISKVNIHAGNYIRDE
jgi:hypothetical protein